MGYNQNDRWILPKNIILSSEDRSQIRTIISSILKGYYPGLYTKGLITLYNGVTLNTEYLTKAVNNQLLLKKIIDDPRREIITNVNSKEDLFMFLTDNKFDLFNYDGKYFKYVYGLLASSSKRGRMFEEKAFQKFKDFAKKKGMDIEILDPTLEEDKNGGIDGKFLWNGRMITIQVKPVDYLFKDKKSDISEYDDNNLVARCKGDIKILKTDYLILANDYETWIFKAKGITVGDNTFIIPKDNIV